MKAYRTYLASVHDHEWAEIITEFEIRECRLCTSMIANDPQYGRKPWSLQGIVQDPKICEVCGDLD